MPGIIRCLLQFEGSKSSQAHELESRLQIHQINILNVHYCYAQISAQAYRLDLSLKFKMCMQKIRNQEEYIKFLEDYMFISESNRPVTGSSYKLPHLAEIIRAYKAEREEVSPVVKMVIILFFIVLTSLLMGVAVIWCINEVIRFEVPFSLRNISLVSSLFFIGKAKLELFKKK